MPGFWDYLSQTADRYNQIRSDLEKEQTELANMYGTQLNNMHSNAMSGINLMGGLLGQKLNTLLGLYGTQTSLEEGERNRQNAINLANLQGEWGLKQTEKSGEFGLEQTRLSGLNALELAKTQSELSKGEKKYETELQDKKTERTKYLAKVDAQEEARILYGPMTLDERDEALNLIKKYGYQSDSQYLYVTKKEHYNKLRQAWGWGYIDKEPRLSGRGK